jgi:hypothetical protein
VVRKPQVVQAQPKEGQQEHWEPEEEMDTTPEAVVVDTTVGVPVTAAAAAAAVQVFLMQQRLL